ncbi:MAG: valine--tRNA ligase [Actinobacteria bacterium]|nr:valine--tRNA ligase [Actinomycetota bacterium]
MAARYASHEVEERLMRRWLERSAFHASAEDSRKAYVISIPPPNVTGSLHMGHALNDTIQDILIRYHHLRGYNTLWVVGTDHAGIATQNKVEGQLAAEGLRKEDIGREAFEKRVWEWRSEYGSTIIHQLKSLGCACDYDSERFTMDEAYQRAVAKVFAALYEKGDIYRDVYLVNWCVRCGSAISDLEVDHEERASKLYYVKYPVAGSDETLTVATTRPETILGDTAVAVNPKDPRYGRLVGKTAVVPLVGREVPIIADEHVDITFGTGALKITPGHDPDDWEIGLRHGLPSVSVIDTDGLMNAEAGEFVGLTVAEARTAVVERLERDGLFVKAEDHNHAVGTCYRCGTTIEPLLSLQWFMDMKRLVEPAIAAVEDGRVRFVPARWGDVYLTWMRGIRPWCISRQLWWGHRIPAYFCEACDHIMVAETAPATCEKCGGSLRQEEDVLDTWFSSQLWPFASLGWPEETPELKTFYPTTVLSTARDIIYLWVARMIMMGFEFMGDVPFADVIIHPTVLAADGRRMSKSLGTGVDPLDLIADYGADATRFGLAYMSSVQDVRFSAERIEMGRNFANKIWNASRLVLQGAHPQAEPKVELATPADRWIFSRLEGVTQEVAGLYESYEFDDVARTLYRFIWNELCDWYLEVAKSRLYSEDEAQRLQVSGNLLALLEQVMILLHPLMPFVTEEIYGYLPQVAAGLRPASLFDAVYPEPRPELADPEAEAAMEVFTTLVGGLRSTREELGLARDVRGRVIIIELEPGASSSLVTMEQAFSQLSGCEISEVATGGEVPAGRFASVNAPGVKALLDLEGLVDVDRERDRLVGKARKAASDAAKSRSKVENQGFLAKAPEAVVAEERSRLAAAEAVLDEVKQQYRERVGGELPLPEKERR